MLRKFSFFVISILIKTTVFAAPMGVDIERNLSNVSQVPYKNKGKPQLITNELENNPATSKKQNFWQKHKNLIIIGSVVAAGAIALCLGIRYFKKSESLWEHDNELPFSSSWDYCNNAQEINSPQALNSPDNLNDDNNNNNNDYDYEPPISDDFGNY